MIFNHMPSSDKRCCVYKKMADIAKWKFYYFQLISTNDLHNRLRRYVCFQLIFS